VQLDAPVGFATALRTWNQARLGGSR
jgi:hypothetical protein